MRISLTLALLLYAAAAWAVPYTGQVVDELTGDPVAGAEVSDRQGQAVKTNEDGTFVLETEDPNVKVAMPGFQEAAFMLKPDETNRIALKLKGVYQIEKVEVKASPDAKKVVVSKQRMEKEEIKKVTTTIFPDVAKAVQLLPGVQASSDFSSLLYVRGGDPDEVVSVLDDMLIPNPYMWGGLVSIFDPAMVESVEFSTGGFPAEWPQAMSAILNVKNKVSSPERFAGFADVSAASLDLFLQGPLAGNLGGSQDSSFLAGVRRTYYDLQQRLMYPDKDTNMTYPYFYDGQLKASLPLKYGTVTVNSHFSVEGMDMVTKAEEGYDAAHAGDSTFDYVVSQMQLGVSHDLKLSDQASVLTLAGIQLSSSDAQVLSNVPVESKQTAALWQLRNVWQWLPNDRHIVKAGLHFFPGSAELSYKIRYKVATPNSPSGYYEETITQDARLDYTYSGVFVQDDIEVLEDLFFVSPGVNGQYFRNTGQWIGNPRMALKVKLTPAWETYVAGGLYSQFALDATGLDDKIGNPHLLARESLHYVWGSKMDVGQDFSVQLESYYKDYRNLVTPDPDPTVNFTNNAVGHAYGVDLIIQKKVTGNWDGWLTYSYLKSERKITARNDPRLYGKPEDPPPVGEWYPADTNRPHTVNLIVKSTITPGWKLALTQKYCTGKPYTPVVGREAHPTDPNVWSPQYGDYNSARMPDFWSTDIKLAMPVGRFKGWTAYCQLSNIFNVKNVDSYQYRTDYSDKREINQYPFMVIGGIRFEF